MVRDLIAGRRRRWTQVWLILAVAVCAGLFVLVYRLAVHTTRGRLLDGAAFRGAVVSRSRVTGYVEGVLDVVSVLVLLVAAAAIVGIALLRRQRWLAAAAVTLVVGANLTSQLLKSSVLSRPDLGLHETTPATLNSLPSGHSTVAFSVVAALVLVAPAVLRPLFAVVGVAFASVTGLATLSAGWHRPSDSVSAFLVVGGWAAAVATVLVVVTPGPDGPRPDAHRRTPRRLAVVAAYLLAFGGLLSVVIVGTSLTDDGGAAALVPAYLAGGGAIAGTASGLMAGLLAVVHQLTPVASDRPMRNEPLGVAD